MVLTWLDWFEPLAGVSPRDHVLFHTECWNKKTVDYILRGHGENHCAIDGHMQFVDLAFAFGVLQLPHPLSANHLHVDCVGRAAFHPEINECAPRKQSKSQHDRARCPAGLQQLRSGAWMRTVGFRSAPIFHRKKNDRQENDREEKK